MSDKRKQILLVVALVRVGVFLADRLIVKRLTKLWGNRSTEIAELAKKYESGQDLLDRENDLRERWGGMLKRGLPIDESVAENTVLQAVARWTRESGLVISSLKPRWVVNEDEEFKRVEFTAIAQGNLESIARFIYEIEHDSLAVKVDEVEVMSQDDLGGRLALDLRFSGLAMRGDAQ